MLPAKRRLPLRRIAQIILFVPISLTFVSCGVGQFRKLHNQAMYEIIAEKHEYVYRAAFEICRSQHRRGYKVIRQPLIYDRDFKGVFQCEGEFDPTLAVRYEYLPTKFKFGHAPLTSNYYFDFVQRYGAENKSGKVRRTNTLNEEGVDKLMGLE